MNIYQTNRPFIKLFDISTATVPKKSMGAGIARFVGDGTIQHGRLKVSREGETEPTWWVEQDHLDELTEAEQSLDLPPIADLEFHEDAVLAARMLSGFLDAGGMNVEYLLLLAWAESGWTNTDSEGRDGTDADLDGPIGPYRFDKKLWSSLLQDNKYDPVLRGFKEIDRATSQAQCFFAAANANRLQLALKKNIDGIDPPAWLLRVGHRIGEKAIIRFAQLGDADIISTEVVGTKAVSAPTANANPKLFVNKSNTTKSEVHAAVKAEFESAKRAVEKRLGDLVQESAIDGIIDGSSPGNRLGALGLLDFIAKFESGGNYNAVVDRAKNESNPRLVTMNIAEVLSYQGTLGNRNACGKYQIVKSTLNGNFAAAGLTKDDLFDADGQDKIAYQLLMQVRKGEAFLNSNGNQAELEMFALAVAKEWAAMPVLNAMIGHKGVALQRGDSFYSGTAGNKALTSANNLEAAIRKFTVET